MPKTAAENLEKRDVRLPPALWEELDGLEKTLGIKPAEIYRRAMSVGLIGLKKEAIAATQYDNAQLVNQKLKQRQERTFEIMREIGQIMNLLSGGETKEKLDELFDRLQEYLTN